MQINYRPEIDELRTLAVLTVIIFHMEFILVELCSYAGIVNYADDDYLSQQGTEFLKNKLTKTIQKQLTPTT